MRKIIVGGSLLLLSISLLAFSFYQEKPKFGTENKQIHRIYVKKEIPKESFFRP